MHGRMMRILGQHRSTALLGCLTAMAFGTYRASANANPFSSLPLYVGAENREYRLRFPARIRLPGYGKPTDRSVSEAIQRQIKHLAGPMHFGAKWITSPKSTYSVRNLRITRMAGPLARYQAEYDYEGVIVGPLAMPSEIEVVIALQPERLYEDSRKGLAPDEGSSCTSWHYPGPKEFWYFWSPARPGCKLVPGKDFARVPARIEPLPAARDTRPEYGRMPDAEGVIPISVYFGMNESLGQGNPYLSTDDGASPYRDTAEELEKLGFRRTKPKQTRPLSRLTEDFEKDVSAGGRAARIRVRLYFGDTRYQSPTSRAFYAAIRPALENDAVVIYSGHSGLGQNMSLTRIARATGKPIRLDPSRYQLIFFDSCSSYEYFNEEYFRAKSTPSDPAGTRGLDIITNGLETNFNQGGGRAKSLIRAVHAWAVTAKATPYSELLDSFPGRTLTGVLGDEDNPAYFPAAR